MKYETYFLLNYVTRFPENQSDSESRIVRLIGNRFLGSRAWFKTPINWLLVIFDDRNTTNNQRFFLIYLIVSFQVCCRKRTNLLQSSGKLYHMRLWVECTLFVIYNAGHEPTRIGDRLVWVVRSNDLTHWATLWHNPILIPHE